MRVTYELVLSVLSQYHEEKGFFRRHGIKASENDLIAKINKCLPAVVRPDRLVNEAFWTNLKTLAQQVRETGKAVFSPDPEQTKPASARALVRLFQLQIQQDSFDETSAVQEAQEWFGDSFAKAFKKSTLGPDSLSSGSSSFADEEKEDLDEPSLLIQHRLELITRFLNNLLTISPIEEKKKIKVIKNLVSYCLTVDSGKAFFSTLSFHDRDIQIMERMTQNISYDSTGRMFIRYADRVESFSLGKWERLSLEAFAMMAGIRAFSLGPVSQHVLKKSLGLVLLRNAELLRGLSKKWFPSREGFLRQLVMFPLRCLNSEHASFLNQFNPDQVTPRLLSCLEQIEGIPFPNIPVGFLTDAGLFALTGVFKIPFIRAYSKELQLLSPENLIQKAENLRSYVDADLFERAPPGRFLLAINQLWRFKVPELFLRRDWVEAFAQEEIVDFEELSDGLKAFNTHIFTRELPLPVPLKPEILRLLIQTLRDKSAPALAEMDLWAFNANSAAREEFHRQLQAFVKASRISNFRSSPSPLMA